MHSLYAVFPPPGPKKARIDTRLDLSVSLLSAPHESKVVAEEKRITFDTEKAGILCRSGFITQGDWAGLQVKAKRIKKTKEELFADNKNLQAEEREVWLFMQIIDHQNMEALLGDEEVNRRLGLNWKNFKDSRVYFISIAFNYPDQYIEKGILWKNFIRIEDDMTALVSEFKKKAATARLSVAAAASATAVAPAPAAAAPAPVPPPAASAAVAVAPNP